MSIAFPARVCWSMLDMNRRMKEAATVMPNTRRRRVASLKNEDGEKPFPVPLFVIILPAYKEDNTTLETTLRVLASHPQARLCYHVYLAMEEGEEKSDLKAASLVSTFSSMFYNMSYTIHPSGLDGEAQGKSSNESWAAKQACRDYPDASRKRDIVITVMDADTHLSSRYFQQIARLHTDCAETSETTMYVPPLVFDRNLHRVPLFVRTADMMWCGAGLSSLYQGSTICIPTSVYSLPMALVEEVSGWDTGPGAIGEDLHMYLKCFFALSGNLNVQIVYSAASQCNVQSDLVGIRGYADGIVARYKQALRHMWGSLDTGFAVQLPLSAPNANWTAFYTSTGLHKSLIPKQDTAAPYRPPPRPIHMTNLLTIFHRLFEAHFLPTHLALILATTGLYSLVHPSFLVPHFLRWCLDFAGWCRLLGFTLMMCYFYLYAKYHHFCVELRQEEMRRAGLWEDIAEQDGFSVKVFQVTGLLECALFPIGGFIFGAIPALQAVISHLFTERLTYVVSLKPLAAVKSRARAKSGSMTP
ncbi:hypothetical protein B0A48_10679 [Cryoendolithus antarcticus]|uniref:Glycosyltransferase 2-like domain-containing protein n=1 Tax=Cryoendolithus antarcticus TaxID=1507870 RepID=A0A1V8SY02_9PEZI|nr:hypothetical protein B0A48_10679 [Cryoendolithus antarcticus]